MTLKNYKRVLTAQTLLLAAISVIANYTCFDASKFPYVLGGIFGMLFGTIAHIWMHRVEPETKVVEKTADKKTTLVVETDDIIDTTDITNCTRIEISKNGIYVYTDREAPVFRSKKTKPSINEV
jgi:hypothetical protein